MFNLTSKTYRALDSIALNISESSILQSIPEYKKFLGYFIRSQAEIVTCLYNARNRNYITEDQFNAFYNRSYELMNKMIAFRNALK